jgi:hydroxymethylbilane synthase
VARRLRISTRSSALARWQAQRVASLLAVDTELVLVDTAGDRMSDRPIHEIGGQGVFVKEVQAAVLRGDADLAVHSAKDLPSGPSPDGLVLACVPERDEPWDALVGASLGELAPGATVATGSVRRRAQLGHARPDLVFVDLRGNMATRLTKVPAGGAVVVALAALHRLGWTDRVAQVLGPGVMLPQVAQGALAVECRVGDEEARARLEPLEDRAARRAVDAERAFLAELGSGCDLPVASLATVEADGDVSVAGLVASLDGATVVRGADRGSDGAAVGRRLARHLLDDRGVGALLGRPPG